MKLDKLPYPQTPESAKAYFRQHGISISAWAKHMGVPRTTVVDLIRGKIKGNYGVAHKTAVILGLKIGEIS